MWFPSTVYEAIILLQNLGPKVATANSFFRLLIDVPLKAKSKEGGRVRFAHDLNVQMNDWIPICLWQDAEPPRQDIYVHGNFTPPTKKLTPSITIKSWIMTRITLDWASNWNVIHIRTWWKEVLLCGERGTLYDCILPVVSHVMTLPAYTKSGFTRVTLSRNNPAISQYVQCGYYYSNHFAMRHHIPKGNVRRRFLDTVRGWNCI